jgi:uncharacterized protein DUF5985
MAEAVYLLCAITGIVCALMLFNRYRENRTRLLFWSSLCFAGLAANNVLLFVDLIILPQIDLSFLRSGVSVASMAVLLYGIIWEP